MIKIQKNKNNQNKGKIKKIMKKNIFISLFITFCIFIGFWFLHSIMIDSNEINNSNLEIIDNKLIDLNKNEIHMNAILYKEINKLQNSIESIGELVGNESIEIKEKLSEIQTKLHQLQTPSIETEKDIKQEETELKKENNNQTKGETKNE